MSDVSPARARILHLGVGPLPRDELSQSPRLSGDVDNYLERKNPYMKDIHLMAFTGPGSLSLDLLVGHRLSGTFSGMAALFVGSLAG